MKLYLLCAVFVGCAGAAPVPFGSGVFEQAAPNPSAAWRARTGGGEVLVFAEGFILRRGQTIRRFRWDRSMHLTSMTAEKLRPTHSYMLSGSSGKTETLALAEEVRAVSRDGRLSVRYYFGARGFEFDVEAQPGRRAPAIRLESLDGDLALRGGDVSVAGEKLLLHAVGYSDSPDGRKSGVAVGYRLDDSRHVRLKIKAYDRRRRLVLDPVITYSTYFAGSGDDQALALREMADGSILLAGNTRSIDLPEGVSVSTLLMQPTVNLDRRCFVARISTTEKRILFTSYFGSGGFITCSAMDLDSAGRILLAGMADRATGIATPDAQYPTSPFGGAPFLARISADGKTLEYSTYLSFIFQTTVLMRAGPGETAYVVLNCGTCDVPDIAEASSSSRTGTVILRYNIAAKRFDQKTHYGGDFGSTVNGMEVAPGGALYLFGVADWQSTLTVKGAFQEAAPVPLSWPGFAAAISPDFQTLLFSSFLGGQQPLSAKNSGRTRIDSIVPLADGTLWLFGSSDDGSIPGLQPARPFPDTNPAPFMIQVKPGAAGLKRGFLASGYGFDTTFSVSSVLVSGAAPCMVSRGSGSFPGGAAPGGTLLLGCLNDAGDDLQQLTSIGYAGFPFPVIVAPSRGGGIWTLGTISGGSGRSLVPYELISSALQPFRPNDPTGVNGDLLLQYIDLKTPKPVLSSPSPLRLTDLQSVYIDTVYLAGQNFAAGMALSVQGNLIPLAPKSASSATLAYRSPSVGDPLAEVLNLRAGNYTGQLVIPLRPQPVVSDPFPVIVSNMPPAAVPLAATGSPRTFNVASPIYADSQVLWNGNQLAMAPTGPNGKLQVQIPPELAPAGQTGEFTVINQRPGGGVQRESVVITDNGSSIVSPGQSFPHIRADAFQVDRARKLLYTFTDVDASHWSVFVYQLPDNIQLQGTSIPKAGATTASFTLSTDGAYLYIADNLLRVTRFPTSTLEQDLQFQLQTDAPPQPLSPIEKRFSIRVLDDLPESVLVVTPGGQMAIYDRGQPRPYTTVDFPDLAVSAMDPVLVTGSYVYALQRADPYGPQVPCLVRYPVDGWGFGQPEDFCYPGIEWGKYPEMKAYSGTLVLQNDWEAFGILSGLDYNSLRVIANFDPARDVVSRTGMNINASFNAAGYRIDFSRMSTGEKLGHFPRINQAIYPTQMTFLDDDTLVYLEKRLANGAVSGPASAVVVSNWRSAMEAYP